MTEKEGFQLVRIIEYEGKACDYIQVVKTTVRRTDDGVVTINHEFVDWNCEGTC